MMRKKVGFKLVFYVFISLFALYLFVGCGNANKKVSEEITACSFNKNISDNLSMISENAKQMISASNDTCIMQMLDELNLLVNRDSSTRTIVVIDSIWVHSDGYVSEEMMELGCRLFFGSYEKVFKYLLEKSRDGSNNFEGLIVGSLGVYLSDADDYEAERRNLKKFIYDKANELGMSDVEKKYFEELSTKFDSKMFE